MDERTCYDYYLSQAKTGGGNDFYDPTQGGGLFSIFSKIIPFISKAIKPAAKLIKPALPVIKSTIKQKILPNLMQKGVEAASDVLLKNKGIKETVKSKSTQFLNQAIQDTFAVPNTPKKRKRAVNSKQAKRNRKKQRYVI